MFFCSLNFASFVAGTGVALLLPLIAYLVGETIVVSTGLVALDVRTFYFATIVARAAVTFLLPLIADLVGEPSVVLAAA